MADCAPLPRGEVGCQAPSVQYPGSPTKRPCRGNPGAAVFASRRAATAWESQAFIQLNGGAPGRGRSPVRRWLSLVAQLARVAWLCSLGDVVDGPLS